MKDEDGCSSLESIVARIADEFTAERKRGARPDPSVYARRHPAFAHVIRQVLSALDLADLSSWSGVGHSDQAAVEAPPRHLGDFRIVREIGRGGMGIVYEAVQLSLNRRVALKVLPFAAALDPRHLQRFRNEAQSAAQLHHSNIVPVFAVGCERGVHFYAMQFIDGRTLAQVIREMRRGSGSDHPEDHNPSSEPISLEVVQPPPECNITETAAVAALSTERSDGRTEFFRTAARIGMRVAEALDYAHRQGVIHRDIKPANILLDAQGEVWITDFGLARLKNENGLTMSGDFLGTLRYMSPEQTMGSRTPVDHRSDIYSLGATLYELLVLRPVFASQERAVLLRQITSEEPCPLRQLDRAVPVELEIILSKALAKESRARYQTAQELADDLRRFLDHKPIRARRPSLWERTRKWAHRHRPAVWSAIIAFMVSLTILGGSIGWVLRDRVVQQDRAAAEERADNALAASLDLIRVSNSNAEAEDRFAALPRRLPDYLRALSDHGWSPETLTPEEAAERLWRRPRAVRDTILGSVDHAVILARFKQAPEAGWLQAILDRADSDPWRQALRAARQRQDRPAIIRLAAEVDVKTQPRETLFVLELGLFQRAAYDAALGLLRRAQEAYPDDFWINYDLGTTLRWYRPAECQEAIRFLTVATALRPKHPQARFWLGNALAANNQLEEAMQAFRRAIELDPKYARPLYELGLALAQKGRLADSISAYEEAISLTPERPPYRARVNPSRAVIYCDLGTALLRMGRVDEAIVTIGKAIEHRPSFPRPWWLYTFALLRSGRFNDAALAFCQAVSAEIREAIRIMQTRTPRPMARRNTISVE
jgi:serine/threonine protein kinase